MDNRVWLLILLSLLILFGLISVAEPEKLYTTLQSADRLMVALSILSYTIAIVLFAVIWRFLLKTAGLRLSLANNLRLVFSSVFFNVVTPTASYGGEAVRIYLLSKKFHLDSGKGAATVVAHRIIGSLSNSFATITLGIYLILTIGVAKILLAIIAIVTFASFFGFLFFLYLGLRIEWAKALVNRTINLASRYWSVNESTRASIIKSLESYHEGLKVLINSRRTVILSMVFGFLAWFFVNLVALFSFKAVGGDVNPENVVLLFTFFSVSRLIPTGLPEFVGTKEAIFAVLYTASGLPVSVSVAVSLLIRVASQLWMIVLGGAITLQLGLEGFGRDLIT